MNSMKDLKPYYITNTSLKKALVHMDKNAKGVLLLVDINHKLKGVLTDGDLRRHLIKGGTLDDDLSVAVNREITTCLDSISRDVAYNLLLEKQIKHLPVIDGDGNLVDLILDSNESVERDLEGTTMVIMAGGLGTRLRPHTEKCPKPLLEVKGKPILEHICNHFTRQGISQYIFSVNYLGHMIEDYFQDGANIEANIRYIREGKRLGTVGGLSLFTEDDRPDKRFFLTNGDVMTDVSAYDFLEYHKDNKADLTVGVRAYEMQVPFGVLEIEKGELRGMVEKPRYSFPINAAFYLLEPEILDLLELNSYCDMPDLILEAIKVGKKVITYPIYEDWIDVGHPEELKVARTETPYEDRTQ